MMWPKSNKYKAKRTSDGFPSKLESAVYGHLLLLQKMGKISDIKQQQTIVLQDGPDSERIAWKCDFSAIDTETGELFYIEAKGVEDATYKLKIKLYRKIAPARLVIYKGTHKRVYEAEIIQKKLPINCEAGCQCSCHKK